MSSDHTKAVYLIKLLEVMRERSYPVAPVLTACGISEASLQDHDASIPISQYLMGVEEAVAMSEIADLGFLVGEHTTPLEHGVLGNIKGGGRRFVANPALRLFAEFARESGYRTAGFVSAASVSKHTGIALGFEVWDEPESIRRVASGTNEPLLDWVDRFDGDRPFFPARSAK